MNPMASNKELKAHILFFVFQAELCEYRVLYEKCKNELPDHLKLNVSRRTFRNYIDFLIKEGSLDKFQKKKNTLIKLAITEKGKKEMNIYFDWIEYLLSCMDEKKAWRIRVK